MNCKQEYEYLKQHNINNLEDLIGQTVYLTFPAQGIQARKITKIQFTKGTMDWYFSANSTCKISELGETIFFTEDEAVAYQHSIMEQYTQRQQERIIAREQRQKEEDLKQLNTLINKYSDSIRIDNNGNVMI